MIGLLQLKEVLGTRRWILYLLAMSAFAVAGLLTLVLAVVMLSWI